jgi:hypothetical protein
LGGYIRYVIDTGHKFPENREASASLMADGGWRMAMAHGGWRMANGETASPEGRRKKDDPPLRG